MNQRFIPKYLLPFLLIGLLLGCAKKNNQASETPPIKVPLDYLAQDLSTLRANFKTPPKQAGPWIYWFWFDNVVSREEISRELEEMAERGIAGVELRVISMHGFPGGSPGKGFTPAEWEKIGQKRYEYLSPDHIDILAHTFAEAKRLGLRFAMNLGMGWPPGGRWVTDEYRSRHLVSEAYETAGNKQVQRTFDVEKALDVKVKAWRITQGKAVDPASVIDLSQKIDAKGQLTWDVPDGKWLIGVFKSMPGGMVDKGEGPELDPASKEAVEFHLNEMFGRMEPKLTPYFGSTLVDMATDSWEYIRNKKGRYWSKAILESSQEKLGYDLGDRMYAFLGYGPDEQKVKEDLVKLEEDLIYENYFLTVKKFLDARVLNHRPQVYGRGLERDFFEVYSIVDVAELEEGVYLPDAVWVSRMLDKPIISNESFTHSSIRGVNLKYDGQRGEFSAVTKPEDMWKTTPELLKSLMNAHYARSLNRIQMHSFSYSPPEIPYPGWRMYAEAHINRLVPWWGSFKDLNTWVARTQYVLQSGEPLTDSFVYPVEPNPIDGPFNVIPDQPWTAMNAIDAANPILLARMAERVDDLKGRIKNIILRDDIATVAEAGNLAKFLGTGIPIRCTARMPADWSAFRENGAAALKKRFTDAVAAGQITDASGKDWLAVARENQSVRWQDADAKLSFQQRRIGGATVYLLSSWEDGFAGEVSFPASESTPEIWNAETGEVTVLQDFKVEGQRVTMPLKMGKNESMIVVFPNKTGN